MLGKKPWKAALNLWEKQRKKMKIYSKWKQRPWLTDVSP